MSRPYAISLASPGRWLLRASTPQCPTAARQVIAVRPLRRLPTPAFFPVATIPVQGQVRRHKHGSARSRAAPAPSTRRRPPPQEVPRPQTEPPEGRKLDILDIPRANVWEDMRRELEKLGMDPAATRLDAHECVSIATRYLSAIATAGRNWKPTQIHGMGISPSDLYFVAILLAQPSARNTSAGHLLLGLGWHMLNTGSELGHTPSVMTVTLQNLGRCAGKGQRLSELEPVALKAARRFENYFKSTPAARSDPDALTLAGMIAVDRGDDRHALLWLEEAVKVGGSRSSRAGAPPSSSSSSSSPSTPVEGVSSSGNSTVIPTIRTPTMREPRWQVESWALLTLGTLYRKQGKQQLAESHFRTLAYELDVPEGYMELASVLPETDPEREMCLLTGAMSGKEAAYKPLAFLEWARAAEAADQWAENRRAEHAWMAGEWERLAAASTA